MWRIRSPKTKPNSVALVRKRTIPTERPPLVGEVIANLWRIEGVTWSAQRIPTAVNLDFLDPGIRSRNFVIMMVAMATASVTSCVMCYVRSGK
jgi:hypothetical protein